MAESIRMEGVSVRDFPVTPVHAPKPLTLIEVLDEDLAKYPEIFSKAFERASKTAQTRQNIQQMMKRSRVDGSRYSRRRPTRRNSHLNGGLMGGWEHLALQPIAQVDPNINSNLAHSSESRGREVDSDLDDGESQTIQGTLHKIVRDVSNIDWLDKKQRDILINLFISDLATRYNHLNQMADPQKSPAYNKKLNIRVFEKIGKLSLRILEACRKKKQKMSVLQVFDEETNYARMRTFFLTELFRRLNTSDLRGQAQREINNGVDIRRRNTEKEDSKLHLQEVQSALDRLIHPRPQLAPPPKTTTARSVSNSAQEPYKDPDLQAILQKSINSEPPMLSLTVESLPAAIIETVKGLEVEVVESDTDVSPEAFSGDESSLDGDMQANLDQQKSIISYAPRKDDDLLLQFENGTPHVNRIGIREPGIIRDRYLADSRVIKDSGISDADWYQINVIPLTDEQIHGKSAINKQKEYYDTVEIKGRKFLFSKSQLSQSKFQDNSGALLVEPASAANEFGGASSGVNSSQLDEKLTQFKEIEELYEEIMKTVSSTHFDTMEDFMEFGCPTCPKENELSWMYYSDGYKQNVPKKVPEQKEKVMSASKVHKTIVSDPYGPRLIADDFIKNRQDAMKRVQSSKYSNAYNYGGYIPVKPGSAEDPDDSLYRPSGLSLGDYFKFLKESGSDFTACLLFDDDKERSKTPEITEAERQAALIEAERQRVMQAERDYAESLMKYEPGAWNAGVLEVLEAASMEESQRIQVTTEREQRKKLSDETQIDRIRRLTAGMNLKFMGFKNPDASDEGLDEAPQVIAATLHQDDLQTELEFIWTALKMPYDRKIDMAIRYTDREHSHKMRQATAVWRQACQFVQDREALLLEIGEFECQFSDPSRFFKSDEESSARVILDETSHRQRLLKNLHSLETNIAEVASVLKHTWRETLTYEGVPYHVKVQNDYSKLLFRIKAEREAKLEDKK